MHQSRRQGASHYPSPHQVPLRLQHLRKGLLPHLRQLHQLQGCVPAAQFRTAASPGGIPGAGAEREGRPAAKEAPDIEQIRAIWQRFAALRKQAGLTPDEYKGKIDCPWMMTERDMLEQESGTAKITPETFLPYGARVYLSDIRRWAAAADALGCSVELPD